MRGISKGRDMGKGNYEGEDAERGNRDMGRQGEVREERNTGERSP